MTRPLSSGRPPSAPPTPNGHAAQPLLVSEQDDQVRMISVIFVPSSVFVLVSAVQMELNLTFDPSGAGSGAAGLRSGARGRDLCVPGREGPDSVVQSAGSESSLPAGQQRLACSRGLGGPECAQNSLTHPSKRCRVRVWFSAPCRVKRTLGGTKDGSVNLSSITVISEAAPSLAGVVWLS